MALTRLDRWLEYFPAFQLAILKIDSNIGSRISTAAGKVGSQQFAKLDQAIDAQRRHYPPTSQSGGFNDCRIVAALHHHIVHLPNSAHESAMLLQDAGDLRNRLAHAGLDLILHGHRHQANQVGLIHWGSKGEELRTVVLAGGSACANDADDGRHTVNMIRVQNHYLDIWRGQLIGNRFNGLEGEPAFRLRLPFIAKPEGLQGRVADIVMSEVLGDSLAASELAGDQHHHYTSINVTGFIDDALNYHGNYVLEGQNQSGRVTEAIPFHVMAVGAQHPGDLHLEAVDLLTSSPLEAVFVKDVRRSQLLPFEIRFHSPLQHGERFRIRMRFTLTHVMLEHSDYDIVNLLRYPCGVDRVSICLLAVRTIELPMLLAVGRRAIADTGMRIDTVNAVDVSWTGASETGTANGVTVTVDKPAAQCYLLYYHRLSRRS